MINIKYICNSINYLPFGQVNTDQSDVVKVFNNMTIFFELFAIYQEKFDFNQPFSSNTFTKPTGTPPPGIPVNMLV